MGNAAWVNTGGLFYTQESSNNKQFYVHTYEGHGEANTESVRLQLFYNITKIYYKPGSKWNSKYPQMWELECYDEADEANYGSPATITCTDNEQLVEGVYMMGFGTDIGKLQNQIYTNLNFVIFSWKWSPKYSSYEHSRSQKR